MGSVGGQVCRQRSSKELFHVAVARLHLGHCIATRRPLPLRRPFVTWRCARNVAAPGGRPKKSAERTTAVASDAARRTWGPSIASPSSRPSAASIADRRASMSCRGSPYAQAAGMARDPSHNDNPEDFRAFGPKGAGPNPEHHRALASGRSETSGYEHSATSSWSGCVEATGQGLGARSGMESLHPHRGCS